jgi:hypothetical protein
VEPSSGNSSRIIFTRLTVPFKDKREWTIKKARDGQ